MVDAAFTFAGIDALHASVFLSNTASQQVLEKSGFHFEDVRMCRAPARGGSVHANGYVLTRKTWASLKRWRAPIIEGLQFDVPRPVFPAELAACA
jgi:RimJ/RimL family protein N-acetyltransferase